MMPPTQINEVKIKRILNPTAIDLGEYVINPYMGCEFSCLYCYVRSNRVISKKKEPWGEYVDIRINAPELLEKELLAKRPGTVLLGSTTECFQPAEKKYGITKKALEILNSHKVHYVILTRSPYILDCLSLLKQGFCRKIYFSTNNFSQKFKDRLEPKSPQFAIRDEAINALLSEGVPVVPYFSPLLPWISDFSDIFFRFPKAHSLEIECLNFRLKNIDEIVNKIADADQSLASKYKRMLIDKVFYAQVWKQIKGQIRQKAREAGKDFSVYTHNFGNYFENRYSY